MRFDQSSPVPPISDFRRGGGTLNVTKDKGRTDGNLWVLIRMVAGNMKGIKKNLIPHMGDEYIFQCVKIVCQDGNLVSGNQTIFLVQ